MECQDCRTEMRVKRTYPSGTDKDPTTARVHECACGSRFLSEEAITRRLPSVAISSPPVARRRASGTPPNGVKQAADGSETARPCDSSIPKGGLGVSLSEDPFGPPDPNPVVVDPPIRAREPAAPLPSRLPYRPSVIGAATPAFLRVYDSYTNKDGKNAAASAFQVVAESYEGGESALRDAILAWFDTGVLRRHPYGGDTEPRFRPKLEKVIAERRWEDDQSAPRKPAEIFNPYGKIKELPPGVPPPPRPRP